VVLVAKVLGGYVSDRIGRRKTMLIITLVLMVTLYFGQWLMLYGDPFEFGMGQLLLGVPIAMAFGVHGAMLVEIFPLKTRVTSMSFAYSITLALAGGLVPLIATWLISQAGSPMAPVFFIMVYGVIGLPIMLGMKETNHRSLDE
jgi:MFS transporter, MHS family, proline/betaine transporter